MNLAVKNRIDGEQLKTEGWYNIVPASWRDLIELRNLEKKCFPDDAWSFLDLIAVLSFPNFITLKAMINGNMIGFIAGDRRPSKDIAWVATICVLPQHQRNGIGTSLLRACEEQLPEGVLKLAVRKSNISAIKLYEKEGYLPINIWKKYYNKGEDALIMGKDRNNTREDNV